MKITINKSYSDKTGWIVSIPEIFEKEGKIIYQARNTLKEICCGEEKFVVKKYAVPILFNRIAYTFFRESKAKRAYKNALLLLENGICTPHPVAYIEIKNGGLLKEAYFVSVLDKYPFLMRQYVDSVNSGEKVLINFARFTKEMHDKKILHLDYSPGNILFSLDNNGDANFSIIDLNRMQFGKTIGKKERIYNFRRLARAEEVIRIIAGEYARLCRWDIDATVEEAILYSREFWKRTDRKLALKDKLRKNGIKR